MRIDIIDFDGIPDNFYENYYKKAYGEKIGNLYRLDLYEVTYFFEMGWAEVYYKKNKINSIKELIKIGEKWTKSFYIKYLVYRDLRKRGLFPKAAFKYGADFRVYDKEPGPKIPNRIHSKYLVKVYHEEQNIDLKEFSSLNRIANSVRKILIIAVVDKDGDITYYKSQWSPL